MKSPQAIVIALLAVTTIGGATLAWRQYGELVELRASAMNRDERSDLQKRIWDLEKMNRELQDQVAARRSRTTGPEEAVAGTAESERRPGEREGGRGGRGDVRGRGDPMQQATAIRELMNKPEVQAMMSLQQKAAVDARYAALFHSLNLTPEQTEKVKTLLAERGSTRMDVMAAATAQGIDPRENPEAFRKLFADAQNELNSNIKAVLGDNGYAQLQTYEQTLPQRALVTDLQQRLSYTNTPLSASQADALVQILASNQPPRTANAGPSGPPSDAIRVEVTRGPGPGGPPPGRGGDFMSMGVPGLGPIMDGMGRGSGPTVTPAAVAQAQSVLAPAQLAALQQIQQQQQAQQQLQQMVRETLSANQPAAGTTTGSRGSGGTPAPSGAAPQRKTGG